MAKGMVKVNGLEILSGLEEADIPSLPGSKVTSGGFDAAYVIDSTITVGKLDPSLLKYLLGVARVDYGHVGYCKVG